MQVNGSIITTHNKSSQLTLDLWGGAITYFCLKKGTVDQPDDVNPLNFKFEQPAETGEPSFYQGHFLCLGRWGDPSEGEYKAGIPKHGDFTRLRWECGLENNYEGRGNQEGHDNQEEQGKLEGQYNPEEKADSICMEAESVKEGLRIKRTLTLAQEQSCFKVEETVHNIGSLGRMFNMVQHPTIGEPFLGANTRIDCNAAEGFDYAHERYEGNIFSHWPYVANVQGETIDLRYPAKPYDSVFSFIIQPVEEWGWLTAYSPDRGLLLGYVWPREDYPWINLWNHWSDGRLIYRGLEFGTTGIHKPYQEILDKQLTHLLGQRTYGYLDAGGQVTKGYGCFLQNVGPDYKGVDNILCSKGMLSVQEIETGKGFSMKLDM
ncbi:aldose epimerase family protein [Flavitalea flava]